MTPYGASSYRHSPSQSGTPAFVDPFQTARLNPSLLFPSPIGLASQYPKSRLNGQRSSPSTAQIQSNTQASGIPADYQSSFEQSTQIPHEYPGTKDNLHSTTKTPRSAEDPGDRPYPAQQSESVTMRHLEHYHCLQVIRSDDGPIIMDISGPVSRHKAQGMPNGQLTEPADLSQPIATYLSTLDCSALTRNITARSSSFDPDVFLLPT